MAGLAWEAKGLCFVGKPCCSLFNVESQSSFLSVAFAFIMRRCHEGSSSFIRDSSVLDFWVRGKKIKTKMSNTSFISPLKQEEIR